MRLVHFHYKTVSAISEHSSKKSHHFCGAGEVFLCAVVEAAHVSLELSAGADVHIEHAKVSAAEIQS